MRVHNGLIIFLVVVVCNIAYGAAVENLYQAVVPVETRLEKERQQILPQALEQVLVKLTGNLQARQNGVIAMQMPQAARYVQKFYYNNSFYPGQTLLFVTFDAKSIDELIATAKMAKWTQQRPLLLIWLAKDEDGKKSAVEDADPIGAALKLAAAQVGLPIMFPAYDLEDMQQVSLADIWSPNLNAIVKCAERYEADKLLVGRIVQRSLQDWSTQWQLGNGQSWHTLNSNASDLKAVMLQTMKQVLQELTRVNKPQPMTAQQAKASLNVKLNVYGVTGLVDYQRVLDYLQKLPGVQSVQVLNVGADQITLNLGTQITQEALVQQINQARFLVARAGQEQNMLEYELQS